MLSSYSEMIAWLTADANNRKKFVRCLDRVFKNKIVLIENEKAQLLVTVFSAKESNKRIRM